MVELVTEFAHITGRSADDVLQNHFDELMEYINAKEVMT